MLKKFLREAFEIVGGKSVGDLVDLLDGKKYINEFLIAKKMDLTINQTRNFLYKISDQGLVSSIRKKDKRKGWYTYFWKIEILKTLQFYKNELTKRMEQLQHQIKSRETKEFYICENCNIEFTEENALVHDFVCNECGGIVSRKNNVPVIREYNRELEKLKREFLLIEVEFNLEREKLDKIKAREKKKEEEAKKILKEKEKKKRMANKLLNKVIPKKVPKKIKKVVKKAVKKITKKKITKPKIKPVKKKSKKIKKSEK